VSPRTRPASPEDVRKIVAHAQEHLPCHDCGAAPGGPCPQPGRGRTVHQSRFVAAAIAIRRQAKAASRTPEQEAELAVVLARLPRLTREEVEAGRSPAGGFTRKQLAAWGVPWPPPAGWLQALLRGQDGGTLEEASTLTSETVTVLRNYDWLVRHRGLDDVVLAWDTGTLVYGDGGALIAELAHPGFTPATSDEDGNHDHPR
jgi:hypothetical protein